MIFGGITERNKLATKEQITLTQGVGNAINESHITERDIAAEVRSYKMENTNGLGLVFIVDRLVRKYSAPKDFSHASAIHQIKNVSAGAVYVVFFDISTREVISFDREIQGVSARAVA